jgi:small GTP-binding protein
MSGVPRSEKPRLKVILVGHSGVGKTCLIASYLKKPFDGRGLATVSPAYMFQDVTRRDGLIVTLQIWDTAGQERYHSVSQMFYRDADVALVCFEAGKQDSIDSIPSWLEKVKKEVLVCNFIFVGTKGDDLPEDEQATAVASWEKELAGLAPKGVHLTSARTRTGVEDVFRAAAELYTPRQPLSRVANRGQAQAVDQKKKECC